MRFLFDLTHPAVVHMYLPVIAELRSREHAIAVVSRNKDLTTELLNESSLEHVVLSNCRRGKVGMMVELLQREAGLLLIARSYRPHVIAGTSVNAARVAKLIGARSVINNEDDAAMVPLFKWAAYPFADAIVTPWVLEFENHGRRHLTYRGFEKLFYLHPARFSPDSNVREVLSRGSPDGRYILFRFSALKAHHDRGARGLERDLIEGIICQFREKTNIWISSENPLPETWKQYEFPLQKLRMHHALAQSAALICDSQSMSVEAAMLGVKSFRLNSFVGKLSVLNELDRRGLSEGFLPEQAREFEERVCLYLQDIESELAWQQERRQQLLRDVIDPVPWYVNVLERIARGERVTRGHADI